MINMQKIKNIVKLETIVVLKLNIEVLHSICNLKYSIPKEITIFFHNRSNYDFIIKKLAGDFEGQFNCLGENTEK